MTKMHFVLTSTCFILHCVLIAVPQYECSPIEYNKKVYNNNHLEFKDFSRENYINNSNQRIKRDNSIDIKAEDKNETEMNDEAKPERRSLVFQMALEENLRKTVENGEIKPDWLRKLLESVLEKMQNNHYSKDKGKLRWQSIFYNNVQVEKMKKALKEKEVMPDWLPPVLEHVIEMQNSYDFNPDLQLSLSHNQLTENENDKPEWNLIYFQRILEEKLTVAIKKHEVKPDWLTPLLEYVLEEMKNISTTNNEATPKFQHIIFQGFLGKKINETIINSEVKPDWLSQLLQHILVDLQNNSTINDKVKSEWKLFIFKGILREKLEQTIKNKQIKPEWLQQILKHILGKIKNTNNTNDIEDSELLQKILFQMSVIKKLKKDIRKGKVKPVWLTLLLERLLEMQNSDIKPKLQPPVLSDEKLVANHNNSVHLDNENTQTQSVFVTLTTSTEKIKNSIKKGEVKPDWLLPLLEYSLDMQTNNGTKQKLQLQIFQGVLGKKIKESIRKSQIKPDWLSSLLERILDAMQNDKTINIEGNPESKIMIFQNILKKKLKQVIKNNEVKPDWLPDLLKRVLSEIQNESETKSEWQSTIFESSLIVKLKDAIQKKKLKPVWLAMLLEHVLEIHNANVTREETELELLPSHYYKERVEIQNDDNASNNEEDSQNLWRNLRNILEENIWEAIKKDEVKPKWLPMLLKHMLVKTQNLKLTNDEAILEWQSVFGPSGLIEKLKKTFKNGKVKPIWLSSFLKYILDMPIDNVIPDETDGELIESQEDSEYFIDDEPEILSNLEEYLIESNKKPHWQSYDILGDVKSDLQLSPFNNELILKQIDYDFYDNAISVRLPTNDFPSIFEENLKESEENPSCLPTDVLQNINVITELEPALGDDEMMNIQHDNDDEILGKETSMEAIKEADEKFYLITKYVSAKIEKDKFANDKAKLELQFDFHPSSFTKHQKETVTLIPELEVVPLASDFEIELRPTFMDESLEDIETEEQNDNVVDEKQNGIVKMYKVGLIASPIILQEILPYSENHNTVLKWQPKLFQQVLFTKPDINYETIPIWELILFQKFLGANDMKTESEMQTIFFQNDPVNLLHNNVINTKAQSQLWDYAGEDFLNENIQNENRIFDEVFHFTITS